MSKCRPKGDADALAQGIRVEDEQANGAHERFVVVKIPYDKLLNDASISQMKVSDIVKIAIQEPL